MILVAGLQSCASIMEGANQDIIIESNVRGAVIEIDGKIVGKTPATVAVKRQSKARTLTVSKEGYKTEVKLMYTKVTSWFWVGLVVSGSGTSTDSTTGAMYSYAPGRYFIELPEKQAGYQKKAKMRYFVLMNYDRINKDIARGKGEYLNSVCAFYGLKGAGAVKKMLPFLRQAQNNAKSIVAFGNTLVSRI